MTTLLYSVNPSYSSLSFITFFYQPTLTPFNFEAYETEQVYFGCCRLKGKILASIFKLLHLQFLFKHIPWKFQCISILWLYNLHNLLWNIMKCHDLWHSPILLLVSFWYNHWMSNVQMYSQDWALILIHKIKPLLLPHVACLVVAPKHYDHQNVLVSY